MSEAGLMPPGHMQQVAGLQVESSVTPSQPNDYVVVDGYRLVKPYHFDFCCGVRQRWVGQTIIDIFSREFPARDRQYYLQALADGRLRVEGCQVTAKTPLKDGQRMRHFIHRHEPPVPASSIRVVGQSEEAVAVCKPHGMPVHVAGQYRKNTVLGILTAERPDLGPLFPIHRLDKPVSGLLLFARSAAAAAVLCARIDRREVEKLYVARVLGRFPTSEEPIVADVPLAWDPVSNHATAELGTAATTAVELAEAPAEEEASAVASVLPAKDEVGKQGAAAGAVPSAQQNVQQQRRQKQQAEAQAPQPQPANLKEQRQLRKQVQKQQRKHAKAERQAYAAAGASAAAKKPSKGAAKPALTEFRLLAVAEDGQTSIVECRPRTGRTHQIRVHLQFLGHPIANDTQYGGTYGGPLASRQMAQQLGMDWTTARSQQESAEVGDDGASDGVNAAAAGAARGWCSKRARLEAARANGEQNAADVAADVAAERAALGAADATETESQPEEVVAAGIRERAGAVGAYAQSQAFRSRPEFQVAPELFDPMCIHCPYYAPKDYPLDLQPLWLHTCTYSCQTDGWSFSTELPEWASADWVPLSA